MIPVGGTRDELTVTKGHNHPPIRHVKERHDFVRELKNCVRNYPMYTMRFLYDMVKELYLNIHFNWLFLNKLDSRNPEGAAACPYTKVVHSMRRWRNEVNKPLIDNSSKNTEGV